MQCLHQARVFIDREFEEICEEANIADKLQTIDVMCAEQGFDGTRDVRYVINGMVEETRFSETVLGWKCWCGRLYAWVVVLC